MGTINYDIYNDNAIRTSDFTNVDPCSFEKVYQADLAGTAALHDRTSITAVDSSAVPFTKDLRPADSLVLGGSAMDFYLVVSSWSSLTSADIEIAGTDKEDTPQSETITITGNGTYWTAKRYKTSTTSKVSGFSGTGSFGYSVTQGRWGVVHRLRNHYVFDCSQLVLASSGAADYFVDTGKVATFWNSTNTNWPFLFVPNNGNLRLGTLVDPAKKTVKDGCQIHFTGAVGYKDIHAWGTGVINLYGCSFYSTSSGSIKGAGVLNIWGCALLYRFGFSEINNPLSNIDNTSIVGAENGGTYRNLVPLNNLTINGCTLAVFTTPNGVITNVKGKGNFREFYWADAGARSSTLIDCEFDNEVWRMYTDSQPAKWVGYVYRQQTLNYNLVDGSNTKVQNATVSLLDVNSTEVFTLVTDVNGSLPKQEVTRTIYQGTGEVGDDKCTVSHLSPFTYFTAKYGFNKIETTFSLLTPLSFTDVFRVNPFVSATELEAAAIVGVSINYTTKLITITQPTTLQAVYDYSQFLAAQTVNVTKDEPITTADGISFTLGLDWSITIDGAVLNAAGKRIQLTGTGTYSFLNGADIEGVLADVTHTHVKITAPNLLDGTRVYLINDTLGQEVDNSIVSGGSGYVFVADIPSDQLSSGNTVMLFATYCSGLVAKKELSATGILTTAGLLFIDSQEDWLEYASIGIDGSTVTEFTAEYPIIEVNINDPDNVTTKQRLIAWWIYNLSTADGIRFFFEGITTEDAVNYRINNGFNLLLDNLNAAPLMFTDQARLYKASGSTIIATTSNSIQLDSGKVYSPKLDDMLTLDILNATTIPVNVTKINSVTVHGSGVGLDPWGGE